MRFAGFLTVALLAGLSSPSWAGSENLTPEFRRQAVEACTGDAVRFCPQTLLDEERTADCMKSYRTQLSPACRAVYDRGIRTRSH